MINLKSALRTPAAALALETVSIDDIANQIKPVNVRIVEPNVTNGQKYLHLVAADDRYLSIHIGKKVSLSGATPEEQMAELLNKYVVYTGVTKHAPTSGDSVEDVETRWFTFGPVATLTPTIQVSFASLLKGKTLTSAPAMTAVGAK